MHDITELERRIAAAFDRIDRGLESADQNRAAQRAGPDMGVQTNALMRALEAARAASEDWAARYAQLQVEMGDQTIAMAKEISDLTRDLQAAQSGGDTPLQQAAELQVMEDQMNDLRRQLKAKNRELASLRAARDADIAELQAITDALTPLIEKADPDARD